MARYTRPLMQLLFLVVLVAFSLSFARAAWAEPWGAMPDTKSAWERCLEGGTKNSEDCKKLATRKAWLESERRLAARRIPEVAGCFKGVADKAAQRGQRPGALDEELAAACSACWGVYHGRLAAMLQGGKWTRSVPELSESKEKPLVADNAIMCAPSALWDGQDPFIQAELAGLDVEKRVKRLELEAVGSRFAMERESERQRKLVEHAALNPSLQGFNGYDNIVVGPDAVAPSMIAQPGGASSPDDNIAELDFSLDAGRLAQDPDAWTCMQNACGQSSEASAAGGSKRARALVACVKAHDQRVKNAQKDVPPKVRSFPKGIQPSPADMTCKKVGSVDVAAAMKKPASRAPATPLKIDGNGSRSEDIYADLDKPAPAKSAAKATTKPDAKPTVVASKGEEKKITPPTVLAQARSEKRQPAKPPAKTPAKPEVKPEIKPDAQPSETPPAFDEAAIRACLPPGMFIPREVNKEKLVLGVRSEVGATLTALQASCIAKVYETSDAAVFKGNKKVATIPFCAKVAKKSGRFLTQYFDPERWEPAYVRKMTPDDPANFQFAKDCEAGALMAHGKPVNGNVFRVALQAGQRLTLLAKSGNGIGELTENREYAPPRRGESGRTMVVQLAPQDHGAACMAGEVIDPECGELQNHLQAFFMTSPSEERGLVSFSQDAKRGARVRGLATDVLVSYSERMRAGPDPPRRVEKLRA